MATFLYRLGRPAFRRRWYVVVVWLADLGAAGIASAAAPDLPDELAAMPGIEASDALDLVRWRSPSTRTGAGATNQVARREGIGSFRS